MKGRRQRPRDSARNSREPWGMISIKRGEVFLVNLDPAISAITSNVIRIYSSKVEIPSGTAGLKSRLKIMVNQTRAVDKIRLFKKLGQFPQQIMADVEKALKLHYDPE